jgi:uncharacterized protein
MNTLHELSAEFKEAMQKLYGEQLAQVILYGSYARGDYKEHSDVDFAVILRKEPIERWREIERMYPITASLAEKYNQLIAPVILEEKRFKTSQNLFVSNVRREGVVL